LDRSPLILSLSSSLNLLISKFLATIVRNSRHKIEGRRWSFKEKVFALSLPNMALRHIVFSSQYFPYFLEEPSRGGTYGRCVKLTDVLCNACC
jgi:hypothetical protein